MESLQSWEFGLSSDSESEWRRHLQELEDYINQHGDAHIGFRKGDDEELTRQACASANLACSGLCLIPFRKASA